MDGIIVLDKPADFTSFDGVAVLRGLAKERKIGHTGTLDPMATGVLPLLLGRAAKAADLLPDTEKAYRAEFRLGEHRDTGDVTGKVLDQDDTPVSREILQAALENFQGELFQIPPMYSAVSVGGKRLYELARKGIEVEREPRKITVSELVLERYEESTREGVLLVTCSKGTYIRVLIEDIAKAAGTCGTMTALRRTYACGFSEQDALPIEELRRLAAEEKLHTVLRPVESLFGDYPGVQVTPAQKTRFCNGGSLSVERLKMPRIALIDGLRFSVYGADGQFLGLAQANVEKNELRFLKKFV